MGVHVWPYVEGCNMAYNRSNVLLAIALCRVNHHSLSQGLLHYLNGTRKLASHQQLSRLEPRASSGVASGLLPKNHARQWISLTSQIAKH